MTPEIETERLRLVPYRAGLVTQAHVDWLNDPEIVKYSEQRHKVHTLQTQHHYLNTIPSGSHIWLIKLDDNGAIYHIGTITAYVDIHNKVANMGILIGQKGLWGRGYGLEAWTAVVEWLFENDVRKVEAGCMKSNTGMWSIAGRTKMTCDGIVPGHFLLDGRPEPKVTFGKFAP